jgi:hypothetical protein
MTMRTCRHGIEWKSTKVWNTNCPKCEAAAAAYDRDSARLHTAGLERERENEGIRRRRTSARRTGEEMSETWTRRRQVGIANRASLVEERLKGEPERTLEVHLAEVRADAFTPLQREAIVYRYGYGLTQREAAGALGISRDAFRKRLELAQRKLADLQRQSSPRGRWVWVEYKTPYGEGLVHRDTGEPYVEDS